MSSLQEMDVIYQHTCIIGDYSRFTLRYIGYTTTFLSKWISAHLQNGAMRRHSQEQHGLTLNRNHMDANTYILNKY